ncbi:MAG: hypothetical protein ACLQEQ_04060 [Nitrososphaerales archaeon]
MRLLEDKRVGIGELIGTLTMIAITLIAAAVVIGWVNGQAGVSEGQYGKAVANNVNYLDEHFEILNVQFANCAPAGPPRYCSVLQISIYNTGTVALSLSSVTIVGAASTAGGVPTYMYVLATQSNTGAYTSSSFLTEIPGCTNLQYFYTYPTVTTSGTVTTTVVTSDTATTTAQIPQSAIPPAVFTISLPSGSTCPQFVDGSNYRIQVMGAYGNAVTVQATASG